MTATIPEKQPRLLDQLRRCIRDKPYSISTELTYVSLAKWTIRFHGLRHPAEMGPEEICCSLHGTAYARQRLDCVQAISTGKGGNGDVGLVGLLDDEALEVEWMTLMTAAWERNGRLLESVHDRCCVRAEKCLNNNHLHLPGSRLNYLVPTHIDHLRIVISNALWPCCP